VVTNFDETLRRQSSGGVVASAPQRIKEKGRWGNVVSKGFREKRAVGRSPTSGV